MPLKRTIYLLFLILLGPILPGFAQQVTTAEILDYWQHDNKWNTPKYKAVAKEIEYGLPIARYADYDKLAPQVKGDKKLVLYFEVSKLLTERSLAKKNAEQLKDAALALLPLATTLEDKFAQSWYYEHMGDFCLRAAELEKAVYYLLLTVDLHEQLGLAYYSRPVITNVYFLAGRALHQTRDFKKSTYYIQRALKSLEATPKNSVTDVYYRNSDIMLNDLLASNYKKTGDYRPATAHYDKILSRISNDHLDTIKRYQFWKGLTIGNLGQVLLAQGKVSEAKPLLQAGLNASIEYKDGGNTCEFYENLARVQYHLGNYKAAIDNGTKAMALLDKMVYNDKIAADIYDILNKTFTKIGKYDKALQYQDLYYKHQQVYQRLLATSQYKKVEVELNYRYLQQQNRERALKINQLTWLKNTLIAMVLLIMAIGWFVYRNYKLSQQKKLQKISYEKGLAEQDKKTALYQVELFKQHIIEKEDLIQVLEAKAEANWKNADELPESLKTFTLITDEGWNNFRMDFMKAYPRFLTRIKADHGDLTVAEERLAMLIFLKLDNDKIARALGISKDSVGKAKRRLRSTLGFETTGSLEEHIITLV